MEFWVVKGGDDGGLRSFLSEKGEKRYLEREGTFLSFSPCQEFWCLLKHEIRIMFDLFHANEVVLRSLLAYFVALIPKINSPLELKDFRPISLLRCLYKFLSEVHAKRLATAIDA